MLKTITVTISKTKAKSKLLQSQPKPAMWLLTSVSDLELDLERYRNFKEARQGTSISLLHAVAPIRAHSSLGGAH